VSDDSGGRDLALPESWPGLDPGADISIDHTRVRSILRGLRDDLGALKGQAPASGSATWSGPGTAPNVEGTARVGPAETGSWATASAFGSNVEQAYVVLSGTYLELIDRIDDMIAAVELAVTNYERAHAASRA
jgi:hypothetical protein